VKKKKHHKVDDSYQVGNVIGHLKLSISTRSFGVYDSFGDTFTIEVGQEVDKMAGFVLGWWSLWESVITRHLTNLEGVKVRFVQPSVRTRDP
jgi:hypothetical protein